MDCFLCNEFVVQFLLVFRGGPCVGVWIEDVCECFVGTLFHYVLDVVMVVTLFLSILDLYEDGMGGGIWVFNSSISMRSWIYVFWRVGASSLTSFKCFFACFLAVHCCLKERWLAGLRL